jgi:hypothetical protein
LFSIDEEFRFISKKKKVDLLKLWVSIGLADSSEIVVFDGVILRFPWCGVDVWLILYLKCAL